MPRPISPRTPSKESSLSDVARRAHRVPAGAAPRAAAARAVARVIRGATLDDALGDLPALPERDASLARSLAYGACRWPHRLDWQVSELLERAPPAREGQRGARRASR